MALSSLFFAVWKLTPGPPAVAPLMCCFCDDIHKTPPYYATHIFSIYTHTQTNLLCCRLSTLLVHETVPAA